MEVSGRANGVSFSETDDWKQDEKILRPYTHVLKAYTDSKGMRTKMLKAFCYWLNVPADKFALLEELYVKYHLGAILLDDIQDNSFLRKGIPAAHTVYGVASTISSAICVLLFPVQKAFSSIHPDMIKLYTNMFLNSWRGTEMEIYWRDNHTCPSEEEYLEMVELKTVAVYNFIIQTQQLFSENKADFSKITGILGRYLHIRNDYCNLYHHEYLQKKGYCDDITEGKFSFPIMHAIRSHPNDHQVSSILRQRTRDVELKKYCLTLLEKFGSFKHTRDNLEKLDAEMRAEIAKLGGNPMLEDYLDEILDWKRDTDEKHPQI